MKYTDSRGDWHPTEESRAGAERRYAAEEKKHRETQNQLLREQSENHSRSAATQNALLRQQSENQARLAAAQEEEVRVQRAMLAQKAGTDAELTRIAAEQTSILERQAAEQKAHQDFMQDIAQLEKSVESRRIAILAGRVNGRVVSKLAYRAVHDQTVERVGDKYQFLRSEWQEKLRQLDSMLKVCISSHDTLSCTDKFREPKMPQESEELVKLRKYPPAIPPPTFKGLFMVMWLILSVLLPMVLKRPGIANFIETYFECLFPAAVFAALVAYMMMSAHKSQTEKLILLEQNSKLDIENYTKMKADYDRVVEDRKEQTGAIRSSLGVINKIISEVKPALNQFCNKDLSQNRYLAPPAIWGVLIGEIGVYQEKFPNSCHIGDEVAFNDGYSNLVMEIQSMAFSEASKGIEDWIERQFPDISEFEKRLIAN